MSKRVYISTSTEEFKKIGTDGIKFDEFGYGRVYWKELTEDVIIGIEGCDELPYGTLEKSSNELKGMIICTMISFNDQADKRFNLPDKWEFQDDHLGYAELEQFMNTHSTIMVRKDALDAAIFLKSKYNHILPIYHQSEHPVFSYDEYERYCNRYVTQYELYGLTKGDNPILEVFTVDWFNKDAIKYAEDNMGQFIKISTINDIGE